MKGGLLVLAAPSGTGKTTVARALVEGPGQFQFSVSATTRPARGQEVDGVDYHFVSDPEFDRLVADDELLEWANVHGRRYGTLRSEVDRIARELSFAVLDIDVQGALQVKERAPSAVLVFLLPPSGTELVARLTRRGTDDEAEVKRRLAAAIEELGYAEQFDYSVVNTSVPDTVATVRRIVESETHRVERTERFVRQLRDLKAEIEEAAQRAAF